MSALDALVRLGSTTLDVEAELRRSFARLWVARSATTICAFLLAWDVADEVHLLDLVVAPAARRRGIARGLLTTLIAHARERRAGWILLEVRASNLAARRLYEQVGFFPDGERAGYYSDGEDAVLMRFDLGAC